MSRSALLAVLGVLVALGLAEAGGGPSRATARAVTVPAHDVELISQSRGVIEKVLVQEGDLVAAGQPLVQLDAGVQKAEVAISEHKAKSTARAEAAASNLRVKLAAFHRQQMLHRKGVASDADLEEAELDWKYAQSLLTVNREEQRQYQLEAARARVLLDRMTLRAPLAGIVVRRLRDVGEAAEEDRPLIRLVALDVLHVIAYVPPDVAARLRPGQAATLALDGPPARRHRCTILMVDPVVDPASATCRVKLELRNAQRQVLAGSRGTVHFALPSPRTRPAAASADAERRP